MIRLKVLNDVTAPHQYVVQIKTLQMHLFSALTQGFNHFRAEVN